MSGIKVSAKINLLVCIFYSLIIVCMGGLYNFSYAGKIDIKKETGLYKKSLINKKDYIDICNILESYNRYVSESLSVLNNELDNDISLIRKIENYGEFENNEVTVIKNKDKRLDEYAQYLKENGIKIGSTEGITYLYFDPMYIANNFREVLPNNIIEYYTIEVADIREGFEEDAVLTIPWDNLRKRITRYENYLIKISNINCPYIKKFTKEKINLYLNVYMKGLNNSRINEHIDEAKSSYEKFLNENKNSKYYGIIKKYYGDLKRNNFKFGQKEEINNGLRYIGATILDENHKKVYVNDVAETYLKQETSGK